jgi:hypothetical protein
MLGWAVPILLVGFRKVLSQKQANAQGEIIGVVRVPEFCAALGRQSGQAPCDGGGEEVMVVLSEAEAAAVEVAARVTVVAATGTAEVAVMSWVWFETVDVPVLVLVSLRPGRRHPRTRRCP